MALGAQLGRLAEPAFAAVHVYRGHRHLLAATTLYSVAFQAMVILHYVLLARALRLGVPVADLFWIVPVAVLVMMLPVALNAIGIREHVFLFFFASYGISGAAAVAYAWASYGIVLALGLIGGVTYALRP